MLGLLLLEPEGRYVVYLEPSCHPRGGGAGRLVQGRCQAAFATPALAPEWAVGGMTSPGPPDCSMPQGALPSASPYPQPTHLPACLGFASLCIQ